MQYNIYLTHFNKNEYTDELLAIAFTEHNAEVIVKAIREDRGNQQCYYKKEGK